MIHEKFEETVTVVSQEQVGTDIYSMRLRAEQIAAHAKAGQFVSLYSVPRCVSSRAVSATAPLLWRVDS